MEYDKTILIQQVNTVSESTVKLASSMIKSVTIRIHRREYWVLFQIRLAAPNRKQRLSYINTTFKKMHIVRVRSDTEHNSSKAISHSYLPPIHMIGIFSMFLYATIRTPTRTKEERSKYTKGNHNGMSKTTSHNSCVFLI